MTDASKLNYYTGYNTYKNLGVRTASVTVSGSVAAGALADYTSTVTLAENYKFSTGLVKTTDLVGGTPRWQSFPPSFFYAVPASGPVGVTEQTVKLLLEVNGSQVTFKATAFNTYASTLNWTSTTIDFVYAVHTTEI